MNIILYLFKNINFLIKKMKLIIFIIVILVKNVNFPKLFIFFLFCLIIYTI